MRFERTQNVNKLIKTIEVEQLKNIILIVLFAILLFLTGCIAGGGEPYDDSNSSYLPEITLNKTIVDDTKFTITLKTIERKTHPDVGNITTFYFDYTNKTSTDSYLTSSDVQFDNEMVDISVMSFFEEMPANSNGKVSAIFQDIQDQNWTFTFPEQHVQLLLDIVDKKDSSTYLQYPLDVELIN